MDLAQVSFTFSDGREIKVFESTWDSSSLRTRIEEKARADQSRMNGSGDPVFFYFVENFYSYMASCSRGEVPAAEEAYTLADEDLDRWLLSVISVNPESFITVDRSRREEVSFRDGSRFEIVSGYLPSISVKRMRLEEEALRREEDRNNPKDIFAVYLYPILAACSVGDVPPADEVRSSWPEAEIYKWRDAVKEVNPHWFGSTEETEARSTQEIRTIEKKSKKRPRKSPAS